MSGLGDTLAGLAAIRKTFVGASPDLSSGALMSLVRGFGFNPGGLKMLKYIPRNLPPGAALVVVLHGCTQGAAAHAAAAGWLTLADRYGFAVLAPEQDQANNPNRCFNWFEPSDTMRDGGEVASIHAMIGHMVDANALDASRVFVTGLSAGGAMAAAMLATYPEVFAAGAVIAGLPYGAASTVHEALSTMRQGTTLSGPDLKALVTRAAPVPPRWPRLTIWHGSADFTVVLGNATALARQWAALHNFSPLPDTREVNQDWTRQRWLGDAGVVMIETNTLAGLGHGMALATKGEDPIGRTAPYMIETGISSALEIANFWGLAPEGVPARQFGGSPHPPSKKHARQGGPDVGQDVLANLSRRLPLNVTKVITDALTTAGLLK